MPPKRKAKRPKQKSKTRASTSVRQSTRQNVIINIIKPVRKYRNKPYQGVPQIRRIEYVQTYGLGDSVIRQPVINQPRIQAQAQRQALPQPQAQRLERTSSAAQGTRTQRGTLYDASFQTPPRGGAVAYETEPVRYDPSRGRVLQRRRAMPPLRTTSSSEEEIAGAAPKFVD